MRNKKRSRKEQYNSLVNSRKTAMQEPSKVGAKYNGGKAPMGNLLKQFPLALEGVAERSAFGHNKYKEFDADWMNFKRVDNAKEEFINSAVRHLAEIGEENSIEHLKAAAWNILATLQIRLEEESKK